jgi:hypothetical protein
MVAIDPFIDGFEQQQKKPSIRTLGALPFEAKNAQKEVFGKDT